MILNTQKYLLFITLFKDDIKRLVIFKKTFINVFIYFLTYFSTILINFCGKLLLLTNGDNGVIIGHTLGLTVTALQLQYLQLLNMPTPH